MWENTEPKTGMMMKTFTSGQRKQNEENPRAEKKWKEMWKILFFLKFTPHCQSVKNDDKKLDQMRYGKAD